LHQLTKILKDKQRICLNMIMKSQQEYGHLRVVSGQIIDNNALD